MCSIDNCLKLSLQGTFSADIIEQASVELQVNEVILGPN